MAEYNNDGLEPFDFIMDFFSKKIEIHSLVSESGEILLDEEQVFKINDSLPFHSFQKLVSLQKLMEDSRALNAILTKIIEAEEEIGKGEMSYILNFKQVAIPIRLKIGSKRWWHGKNVEIESQSMLGVLDGLKISHVIRRWIVDRSCFNKQKYVNAKILKFFMEDCELFEMIYTYYLSAREINLVKVRK